MKIKSFGCSFIFGSDLPDNPDSKIIANPNGQYSRMTWPALLAQDLGIEYECYARPGSGNLQIAERILNECDQNDTSFFIIGWTYIDRFDYQGPTDVWQPWRTLTPTSELASAEIYYKYLSSEYQDKLQNLIYVKTIIDVCVQKNINFLMTYQDTLLLDQTWHTSTATKLLQEYVKPYMTTFEGKTFLQWSRDYGYLESKNEHPLESAHQAAANYIIDNHKNKLMTINNF
jgi:hypothetical protein